MARHRLRWAAIALLCGIASQSAAQVRTAPDPEIATATAAAQATDPTSKPGDAEAAWRKVIALHRARAKPDAEALAAAENHVGDSLYYAGKPDLAIAEYEKARDLLAAAGMGKSDAMSETLSNLGTMYTASGHPDRDVTIQRDALAMRVALHGADDSRLALNYFNLGNALYETGYPSEAADNIERSVAMRLATMKPDNPELFMSLASAVSMETAAGRLNRAVEYAQQAVALMSEHFAPNHPYAGYVRAVLGKALLEAGRANEAVEVTRQALDELARTMGERSPLTLTAMNNLAVALARLGRYDEARELTLASIARIGKPSPDQVIGYRNISNYAAEAGHDDLALDAAEKGYAAAVATRAPEHEVRGRLALTLAVNLERAGNFARALEMAREGEHILANALDADDPRRFDAAIEVGGLEIRTGERDKGFARVTQAAAALEPMMARAVESPELGGFDSGYYDSFARAAEAAVDTGRPAEAFRYFQLSTYNLNALASQQVALRSAAGRGSTTADEARALQDGLAGLRALNIERSSLLGAGKVARAREVGAAISAEQQRLAGLRTALARAVPGYDRYSRPEVVPLEALQARLGAGEGLVVALPSRNRTTLMAVTRNRVALTSSPMSRAQLRVLTGAIRRSVDQGLTATATRMPAFDLAASHDLYAALFPRPIQAALAGVTRLHVAASDALSTVPFALLATELPRRPGDDAALRKAHWLIRDMSIDVPVTLASIGDDRKAAMTVAFGGIGAPHLAGAPDARIRVAALFRGSDADVAAIRQLPSLPSALGELEAMRRAFGNDGAMLLTGDEATETRLKATDLGRFSVLAFATHGLIAGQLDGLREPALVLTPPDRASGDDDGLLTASEIAVLRINADWVILSACNTASGATQFAPSYTGLAHAFLYAGARSLLLSHWQVRDDAASRLSVATVQGAAAGVDRAEALRRATLALIADRKVPGGAHPAVWAPFILIGR